MTDEKWQKINEIFDVALQLNPTQRQEYVNYACGDDADLLSEVESLLENAGDSDFMKAPAVGEVVDEIIEEIKPKTALKGQQLSHYKILSEIAKGGMSEVYLAQDTNLDRQIALKILPEEFAEDRERMSRFVREAKSASALNHPNIIIIHEIGESDGTHFLATEFIDGKTLNEYTKSNPLKFRSALEISIQVVSALDEAHSAGIVHRDIKPDNIMVRDNGLVKILDFGIAKLSEPSGGWSIGEEDSTAIQQPSTNPGMVIGTPNYMSPEQIRGRDVDHQSDIFSFGLVLYEMLSGNTPFSGETTSDVIAAVLTKEPGSPSDIPIELKNILNKTLEKGKKNRYQTAKDLLDDLKEAKEELQKQKRRLERTSSPNPVEPKTQILQTVTTTENESQNSIAVMPFTNMSADEENEYFCDGLAEELLNALSKIEDLKVAARTSAFSFKGKNANVSEIGEKLGVKNVLEGSVRKSGDNLRISVQLINASDGYQLWSERYDREMIDIFDVQDEISLAVVGSLKLELFGDEKAEISKLKPNSSEALDLYLKGRFHLHKITPEGWQKAIEYFQKAIEKDPDYALAYAGLSSALLFYSFFGGVSAVEVIPQAKNAAQRALEINDKLDEAHNALAGIYMFYEWNLEQADQEFRKAIKLNPNNGYGRYQYGLCLAVLNKQEQAILEAEKAIELEPLSLLANFQVSAIYYELGLFEEASSYAERMIEMNSDFYGGYLWRGRALIAQEKFGVAIQMLEKSLSLDEEQNYTRSVLGQAYGLAGDKNKALQLIEEIQYENRNEYVTPFHIARIFSSLRDLDKTFEWLEKAYEERNGELVYLKTTSMLGNGNIWGKELVADKRFIDLLRRMGVSTDVTKQTDKSLEAKTVMLQPDTSEENAYVEPTNESTTNPKFKTQNPKPKWWLFGLLGLIVLVGGFFGYKYLSPNKQIESIAVMPFVNESRNEDVEYLSDGMTETLISSLSRLPNLNVKARSSVFRYKGKNIDVKTIGSELNVQAILNGRVVQRGEQLTLNLALVDVETENVIWSDKYDRKTSDLVTLQNEIAKDVSTKLKSKLSGEEEEEVTKTYTTNTEAYQAYLKGRYYWNRRSAENLKKAIEEFKTAADKDPNYALAYVGLAESYAILHDYTGNPSSETHPQAKAFAERALSIDSSLAEPHATLGLINANLRQWNESEKEFKRAIELNPNYATTYHWYSGLLKTLGRYDESATMIKQANKLDPLSSVISSNISSMYQLQNNHEASVKNSLELLELHPGYTNPYKSLAMSYLKLGRNAEAVSAAEKLVQLTNRNSYGLSSLGYVYAATGKQAEAIAIIKELETKYSRNEAYGYDLAAIHAGLGDKDKAFEWLEKDFQAGRNLFHVRPSIPYESLRDDPRFKDLLKRMGLPE